MAIGGGWRESGVARLNHRAYLANKKKEKNQRHVANRTAKRVPNNRLK